MIDLAPKRPQAYQLLPALAEDQLEALRQSIGESGILQPIEVDEDGRILDGHHRAAIAAELGMACPSRTISNLDESGKRRYALTVNLMRRQLDRSARADLVAQLRGEGMSVRAIAAETGIPKSEVGRSVRDLSSTDSPDQVSQLGHLPERVVGADGKSYPAARPEQKMPAKKAVGTEPIAAERPDKHDPVAIRLPATPEEWDPSSSSVPAMPWPTEQDKPYRQVDESAHAARVSNDIRRLITLAQTFGSDELRQQAIRLYADNLGNAPMPPSGVVSAQELRKAAEAIAALAKDWKKK